MLEKELDNQPVLFTLSTGHNVPRVQLSVSEIKGLMKQLGLVWEYSKKRAPELLFYATESTSDDLLRYIVEPNISITEAGKAVGIVDYESASLVFFKVSIALLVCATTIDIAHEFLRYNRHGTIEGLIAPTTTHLYNKEIPEGLDFQLSIISSVVWSVGHNTHPTNPTAGIIKALNLFNLEDEADLKQILDRCMRANKVFKPILQ